MSHPTIGIDISKETLDVHRLPDGAGRRFTNDKTGHKALIAWIGTQMTRIVFEPTGPYHRALERAAFSMHEFARDFSGIVRIGYTVTGSPRRMQG
jgi:transposase